jgi:DHA1 family multidrug resistance protein-like MFS transporter
MEASRKNLMAVSFSQFGNAFSGNFVHIFLPFFVLKISPYSLQYTLLWVGAIMGVTTLVAAFTSTFWGSLTHRFSPKMLFLRAILVNAITFLLLGFTTNLYLLFTLRLLQGFVTGASTIGLIIVSSTSPRDKVSVNIGFFQASLTLGQLVGPVFGSLAASTLGYRWAFLSASVILFISVAFSYFFVMDVPRLPKAERAFGWATIDKRLMIAWTLGFTAMIQLSFLPSVLPKVFEEFRVAQPVALRLAGIVVMLYTATAMIGTYVWSWLSKRFGIYRVITFLFALGIVFQLLLVFSRGVVDFTVIRMIQTGLVAATFPLIISMFAGESKGSIIGFLSSARFAGNAVGPIMATSILAFSNLTSLYLFISAVALIVFLGFKFCYK